MPRGDRTGPLGNGPMTGRRAGFCSGFGVPGYASSGEGLFSRGEFGRRMSFRGICYGLGRWFRRSGRKDYPGMDSYPAPFQQHDPELEKQSLKNRAVIYQQELDSINRRLSELESVKTPD